jgi:hypothetical protein
VQQGVALASTMKKAISSCSCPACPLISSAMAASSSDEQAFCCVIWLTWPMAVLIWLTHPQESP